VKVATQKSYRLMHTWVGLICGSLLFIAFYAGALTVFTHELGHWLHEVSHEGSAKSEAMAGENTALSALQQRIDALLKAEPEASHGFSVVLPGHSGPDGQILWYQQSSGTQQIVTQDLDGRLQLSPARQDLVSFIYDLHFTAGLPRTAGTYLFGIVCVLYGLALVSGVLIYLPVLARDILAMRWLQGNKTRWLDLHNLLGITSLPFHIMFAWSGAILTIGFILLAPFQFMVFDGKLLDKLEPDFEVLPHVEPAGETRPLVPLDQLYAKAQQVLSGLQIESAYYHDAGDLNGNVTFYGYYQQSAESKTLTQTAAVVLSTADSRTLAQLTPEQFRPGTTFLRGLQSLHYGNFSGDTGKWLYFILGVSGALLFYSGNWLWLRRQLAEKVNWQTRLMNALTNGICLGTVSAVSLLISVAPILPAHWNHPIFCASLFIASLWAMMRPARQSRTELLLICALCTMLIPLLQWIGVVATSPGMTGAAMNLIALVFSVLFIISARFSELNTKRC